jgi:hypothetical protein
VTELPPTKRFFVPVRGKAWSKMSDEEKDEWAWWAAGEVRRQLGMEPETDSEPE